MARTNNPLDFAALPFTSFAINPIIASTAGPNGLDVNGGAAFGAYAGIQSAPTGGVVVSGAVGVGTSVPASLGYLTVTATASPSQSLLFRSGTANFATTTTAAAMQILGGAGAALNNTLTQAAALFLDPNFTANAGVIANAAALRLGSGTAGAGTSGTIANAYGLYAETPSYGGPGTSVYTGYFQGLSGFNVTNPINLVDIGGAVAVGTAAGSVVSPSNGLIVSGLVGFGTSVPDMTSAVNIGPSLTNSTTINTGLLVAPTFAYSSTNPPAPLIGVSYTGNNVSSSAAGAIAGALGSTVTPFASTTGNGSVTSFTGVSVAPSVLVSGTGSPIRAIYGTYVATPQLTGSPTPTNLYNFFVSTATAATNNYTAYFGNSTTGGVGIGVLPINALDVFSSNSASLGTYAGAFASPSFGLIVSGSVGVGTSNTNSSTIALAIGTNTSSTTTLLAVAGAASNQGSNVNLYNINNSGGYSISATDTNVYGLYSHHNIAVAASGTVSNFYNQYYDTNTVSLGASATIVNATGLYVTVPTVAKKNYCATLQGVNYMPSGWTIGPLGGTSDTCNAYIENGTYTPTLTGSTTAGTTTYTTQAGFYTRFGRRVMVDAQIVYTNATGTGNMLFSVPIAARTVTNMVYVGYCTFKNVTLPTSAAGTLGTASTNYPSAILTSGGTTCSFFSTQNASTGASVAMAAPSASPGTITVSLTYLIS